MMNNAEKGSKSIMIKNVKVENNGNLNNESSQEGQIMNITSLQASGSKNRSLGAHVGYVNGNVHYQDQYGQIDNIIQERCNSEQSKSKKTITVKKFNIYED